MGDDTTFYGFGTVGKKTEGSTRLVACTIVERTCRPFSGPLNSETEDAGVVVANAENTY